MDKIEFNSSTHRVVIYKGKPVVLPLMTYWKLSDLKADDTVVIQELGESVDHYERVKVSELSEVTE